MHQPAPWWQVLWSITSIIDSITAIVIFPGLSLIPSTLLLTSRSSDYRKDERVYLVKDGGGVISERLPCAVCRHY